MDIQKAEPRTEPSIRTRTRTRTVEVEEEVEVTSGFDLEVSLSLQEAEHLRALLKCSDLLDPLFYRVERLLHIATEADHTPFSRGQMERGGTRIPVNGLEFNGGKKF